MLHRALISGIILFWLLMTGMLLRVELFPDKDALLPVPIEHIVKLIFLHQQPSDLVLYHKQERLGNLHLQPQRIKDPDKPGRAFLDLLSGNGAVGVKIPGVPYKRATFRFAFDLTERQELLRFDLAITLHSPTGGASRAVKPNDANMSLLLDGRPPRDQYHYSLRQGEAAIKEASGTLAALLADPDLNIMGFDPKILLAQAEASMRGQTATTAAGSKLALQAHRGNLRFNKEDLETFVVNARYADSLDSTAHVSQLGQVLAVKTFLDYDLYDEALSP